MTNAHWDRAVRDHLPVWGISARTCELVSKSENLVYLVRTESDAYALRVHRPGYHEADELIAEHQWLTALVNAGCSVPEPMITTDGERYTRLVAEGGESRFVTVSRWVDGELVGAVLMRSPVGDWPPYLETIGQTMAKLHVATEAWSPPAGFERVAWDAAGLVGPDPVWGRFWEAQGLARSERALLIEARDKAFGELRQCDSPFGLIHADMHPFNLVAADAGLHVIDFDDGGYGWTAYDIAIAIYNFREKAEFEHLRAAFLDGYARHRTPPDIDDINRFLTIRSLVWLGWVADRPDLFSGESGRNALALVVGDAERFLEG